MLDWHDPPTGTVPNTGVTVRVGRFTAANRSKGKWHSVANCFVGHVLNAVATTTRRGSRAKLAMQLVDSIPPCETTAFAGFESRATGGAKAIGQVDILSCQFSLGGHRDGIEISPISNA